MPKSKIDPRRKARHKKVQQRNPDKAANRYSRKVKKMNEDQQATQIYINANKMIQSAAMILPLTREKQLRDNVNTDDLDRLTIIISKDITSFHTELESIRAVHLEVGMNEVKQDRLFAYMSLAEQYGELMDRFNVVITPHLVRLNTMIETARSISPGVNL